MKKKLTKKQAEKEVQEFFKKIEGKTPSQIKKIKKTAMHHRIPLSKYKKLFCKKCYIVFDAKNSRARIKKGKKIVRCLECGHINR